MEKRVECESIWPRCSKSFDSDAAVISCWPRGKNGGELLLNVSSLSNLLSPTLFLSMLRLCTNLVPRSGSRKIFPIFLPPKYYFLICLARISLWNSISRLNRSFFFPLPPFNLNHDFKLGWKKRWEERIRSTRWKFLLVDPCFCNKLWKVGKIIFLINASARSF